MRLEHDPDLDTFTVWLDEPARGRASLGWVDLLPGVRALIDDGPPAPQGMSVVDGDRFVDASVEIFALEVSQISARGARGNADQVADAAGELMRITHAMQAVVALHGSESPKMAAAVAKALRPMADPETVLRIGRDSYNAPD